jgi:hypothetical protein
MARAARRSSTPRGRRAGAPLRAAALLAAGLAVAFLLVGCNTNPEDTTNVVEGQPMKLGELLYNVQISRYLNPSDPEDRAYLVGQPPPSNDQYYLGVFMQIHNESDAAQRLPTQFRVVDTVGTKFKPVPTRSLFALKLGAAVPGNGVLPEPETTAANGPIQGSMVLFRIDSAAIQDRPLTLDIPSSSGVGRVELDI